MTILKDAKGLIAALLVGHGIVKGFDWPSALVVIAMFVIHHWPELAALGVKTKADLDTGNTPGLADDVAQLKDKVNALLVAGAMRGQTKQP